MRQGELDFFKVAVLSKSKEPLILNDDTPMADKTEGTDFMRQFIFEVAMALKKGLHMNMIRNIQIAIHEGNWAVISKNKAPAIHFVIRHPKLLSAIEKFIPPLVE